MRTLIEETETTRTWEVTDEKGQVIGTDVEHLDVAPTPEARVAELEAEVAALKAAIAKASTFAALKTEVGKIEAAEPVKR